MEEKEFAQSIKIKVVEATSPQDLKKLFDEVMNRKFKDETRSSFLFGLIFGALMQYNKELAIDYLDLLKEK